MKFSPTYTFGIHRSSNYSLYHEIFKPIKSAHPNTQIHLQYDPDSFIDDLGYMDLFRRAAMAQAPTLVVAEAMASTSLKRKNCIDAVNMIRDQVLSAQNGIHTKIQRLIVADANFAWTNTPNSENIHTLIALAEQEGIPIITGQRKEISQLVQEQLKAFNPKSVAEAIEIH